MLTISFAVNQEDGNTVTPSFPKTMNKKLKLKENMSQITLITHLSPIMINMICEDHKQQVLNGTNYLYKHDIKNSKAESKHCYFCILFRLRSS